MLVRQPSYELPKAFPTPVGVTRARSPRIPKERGERVRDNDDNHDNRHNRDNRHNHDHETITSGFG